MATYALIHGAYDVGWYWHLVEHELQERGHRTVAPDLPIEDDAATLMDNARFVGDAISAVDAGGELIVVGQSWGGYVAPIVAELAGAHRLVLVAPMIPLPGETNEEMWQATGWTFPGEEAGDPFYHDVDPALVTEARSRERGQSETTSREPWPLHAWPDVRTHVIIGRDDRFFTADWLRGVVRDRLGMTPDELPGGHALALSRPTDLVELIESYRR
jgi:pimeloyl-ACP methyl ester carboxylesterase